MHTETQGCDKTSYSNQASSGELDPSLFPHGEGEGSSKGHF